MLWQGLGRTGDDHDVSLARRRAEDDAEAVHVIPGSRCVHHLHRASGEAKGHRPHGGFACPVYQAVEAGQDELDALRRGREGRQTG